MSSLAVGPALVVLAAGASRRLGRCKATVELGGTSALARLVAAGAALDAGAALVVTGAHDAEIRAALPAGARALFNPNWTAGRTGGIVLASRALAGRDLCIAPVDAPLVPADVFRALGDAWRAAGAPARGWLAPVLAQGDRAGHPIVIGRELVGSLRADEPDRPLRELRGEAEPLLTVVVESAAIFDDLDTPDDLARLRARLATGR